MSKAQKKQVNGKNDYGMWVDSMAYGIGLNDSTSIYGKSHL